MHPSNLVLLLIFYWQALKLNFTSRLKETVVEKEEAEAEVTHEKNERVKEFKSEQELKTAELELIKSEVGIKLWNINRLRIGIFYMYFLQAMC